MSLNFIIRPAVIEDAGNILEFARQVITNSDMLLITPEEYTYTLEYEQNWIQKAAENPDALIIVAEVDGQIAGMLDTRRNARKRIAHWCEFGMSVGAAYRSQGIGTALVEYLVKWAQAHPAIEQVRLQVFADNAHAIQLYKKMGFVQDGYQLRTCKMEDGSYKDNIQMGLMVKPAVAVPPLVSR
jgi:RimJ/RimL family protein N-acetyltransferase